MGDETETRATDTINRLLKDKDDWPALLARVQDEMKEIARSAKRREGEREFWRTTDLVNEVNVKLLDGRDFPSGEARGQFFAYVMETMLNTLRDHARRRNAQKRGGGAVHESIEELVGTHQEPGELTMTGNRLIDFSRQLKKLENKKHIAVLIARFFGKSFKEIAEEMGVSERMAKRYLQAAKVKIEDRIEGKV